MHIRLFVFFLFSLAFCANAHEGNSGGKYTFIENKGQWSEKVNFKAEVEGATIYFENNAFHYQFINIPDFHLGNQPEDTLIRGHIFNANFVGSNNEVSISKSGRSDWYHNYFLGSDSTQWKGKVRAYQNITYNNLYSGIDLEVYQEKGFMKYDYRVKPGSSIDQIRVNYEGVDGIDIRRGELVISHSLGKMIEEKPFAYQLIEGEKVEIPCRYKVFKDGNVGFEFPEGYNKTIELIIDPVLIFSTYSGSIANNFGQTATYDNLGNAYMGGIASSSGYVITPGAFQQSYGTGQWDIAISKFNSTGDSLKYSTYIGGSNAETVHSLVVDDAFNLYLLGATGSTNYPTTFNAHQLAKVNSTGTIETDITVNFTNGCDIVVTKFNADGTSLLGSTYYGGNGIDGINQNTLNHSYGNLNFNYGDSHRGEIVIDSLGFCYIGTSSLSSGLSTIPGNLYSGNQDGLIVKFNDNLSSVVWSRYLGGINRDAIYSLKVIDNNRVLVGGGTTSFTNFPTTPNTYAPTSFGGDADGFISIISADGTTLEKSTFIGTSNYDQVYFIEFDRFNNVYAYGQSEGGAFPVKNSPNADAGAGQFLLKMDQNLDSLVFSKTFGDGQGIGELNISPTAFLVDKCQNLYAAGWGGSIRDGLEGDKTITNGMQIVSDTSYGTRNASAFYLYVTYLNPATNEDIVRYANFIGGSISDDHVDGGTSRFDKNGVVYHSVCASCGGSTSDFPTDSTAYSRTDNSATGSQCNNLVFKLDFDIVIEAEFSLSDNEICLEPGKIDSVTVFNNTLESDITTWDFYGDTVVSSFIDTVVYFTTPGIYEIRQIVFDSICAIGAFKDLRVAIRPDDINILTSSDTLACLSDSIEISAFTNGFANEFTWSRNRDFSSPLAFNPSDSTPTVKLLPGNNRFFVMASDPSRNACEKIDSVDVFYFPVDANAFADADTVCIGSPVQFTSIISNVDSFAWDFGNSVINFTDTNISYTYPSAGTYTVDFYYRTDFCDTSRTITFEVTVLDNDLQIDPLADTLFCGTGNFEVSKVTSGTLVSQYVWSSSPNFSDTLNASISSDFFVVNSRDSTQYYLKISNRYCEATDSLFVEYLPYQLSLPPLFDTACFTDFGLELQPVIIGTDSFRINYGNGLFTTNDSTPFLQYATAGTYTIELIGNNARCGIRDTIPKSITVVPNDLELTTLQDTITCNLTPVTLTQSTNGTASEFIWSSSPTFNDTLNTSLSDSSVQVNPNNISQYYIRISDNFCFKQDSVSVEPIQYNLLLDELPDSVCTGFEQLLSTTVNGLDSFRINYGNQTTITDPTPLIQVNQQGIYQVELIGSNARCNFIDTLFEPITVFKDVEIESLMDSLVCIGDTVVLTANTFGTGKKFFWDDSPLFDSPFNTAVDTVLRISPTQATRYYFRAENVICLAEDTVFISTEEVDISVDDFISSCLEDTFDIEAFVNTVSTPLTYLWTPSDSIISGQNSTTVQVSPKNDLQFFLATTSETGCKDFDTVEVEVNQPAFTDAIIFGNDSLFTGQKTQLSTNRNGSNLVYFWEPQDGLSDPTSPNPQLELGQTQEYKVTITDLNTGCVVQAFRKLFVFEVNCGKPDIFVPTAFSPNNDLTNDVLFVRGANLREVQFQLFNRWGELVFETNDLNTGWDGLYKGKPVEQGVFAYQLRAVCFDGQKYYDKGNITLIR